MMCMYVSKSVFESTIIATMQLTLIQIYGPHYPIMTFNTPPPPLHKMYRDKYNDRCGSPILYSDCDMPMTCYSQINLWKISNLEARGCKKENQFI